MGIWLLLGCDQPVRDKFIEDPQSSIQAGIIRPTPVEDMEVGTVAKLSVAVVKRTHEGARQHGLADIAQASLFEDMH